jgi:hypothetical protein
VTIEINEQDGTILSVTNGSKHRLKPDGSMTIIPESGIAYTIPSGDRRIQGVLGDAVAAMGKAARRWHGYAD